MINLAFSKNKIYYVVGLGKSNDAVLSALKKAGAHCIVWDDNPETLKKYDNFDVQSPEKINWAQCTSLVIAPGIPPSHITVKMASEHNVPVICDVDLFMQALPQTKIIGITGTNGKSTTTALIHHILETVGSSQIGGNFGVPVMNLKDKCDHTVLELSSYQLERTPHLYCHVSILLNITPDHLEWHKTMDAYVRTKEKIFGEAKVKIISIDDEFSKNIADRYQDCIRLSVFDKHHSINAHMFSRLKGDHNFQNALAAYHACLSLGVSHDKIIQAMYSFEGLAHRQFLVRIINGVPYINDSKATNADATKMALRAYNNILWIAGGRPKSDGIEPLASCLMPIQRAYLYGEAATDFHEFLSGHGLQSKIFNNLEEALIEAHKEAQDLKGEPNGAPTVLFSPACASFDQYQNFEQRGDHFVKLVNNLKEE